VPFNDHMMLGAGIARVDRRGAQMILPELSEQGGMPAGPYAGPHRPGTRATRWWRTRTETTGTREPPSKQQATSAPCLSPLRMPLRSGGPSPRPIQELVRTATPCA
jgi:hypothetical protein